MLASATGVTAAAWLSSVLLLLALLAGGCFGATSAVSAWQPPCPQGMVPTVDGSCAYRLGVAVPFRQLSRSYRAVAAFMAVEHINERNVSIVPQASLLPEGFRLDPVLLDSQFTPAGGVSAGTGAQAAGAIAVVGAARSSATIPLASIMQVTRTPVVSYASTSPDLSSASTFPFFARTIPTDAAAAKAMARLMMTQFGWRRLGILYVDDSYGSAYFHAFRAGCNAVALELGLPLSEFQVTGAPITSFGADFSLQHMKNLGVRVFALVLIGESIPAFLRSAMKLGMTGQGYSYVTVDSDITSVLRAPEEHGATQAEVPGFVGAMQGFLRLYFGSIREPQYGILQELARRRAQDVMPQEFQDMLTAEGLDKDEYYSKGINGDTFGVYAYDAVWAVALALATAEREVPSWLRAECGGDGVNCHGQQLSHLIRGGSFDGASSTVMFLRQTDDLGQDILLGDRDESYMSLPLEHFDPVSMDWVRVGELRREEGEQKLVLERAITWPGYSDTPPLDGSSCEAGWFFDEVTVSCSRCAPGTFTSLRGQSSCTPCAPGFRCGQPGCTTCFTCDEGTFRDAPGGAGCTACPNNTMTATRASTSRNQCVCREGHYRLDGAAGEPCYACPNGAECHGGSNAPFAAMGYWGDWPAVVEAATRDGRVVDSDLLGAIHTFSFRKCLNALHCTNDCGALVTDDPAGTVVEALEALRACRSNTSHICDPRYTDNLCSLCSPGFFSLGGQCLRCLEPAVPFVTGCVLLIIAAWYLINRIAAGRYEAVDLMLLFFQNASTISFFSLGWAEFLVDGPFWVLAIVNFDVDFFKPDCLATSGAPVWSFGHSLILQLGLPLIVAAFCAALYGASLVVIKGRERQALARVARIRVSRLGLPGEQQQRPVAMKLLRRGEQAGRSLLHVFGLATNREMLDDLLDNSVAAFTSFLNVIYHTMTAKCLETFMCHSVPDGSQFMVSAPTIPCWEGWHLGYVAISIVFLLIYSVGIPACFLTILAYGRAHDLFRHERFMRMFGWLYLRYEREWYWWEGTIMLRRGLLVVTLVLAARFPSLQVIAGMAICATALTIHFYARPFVSMQLDYLEQFSLMSLVGLLCTGILFFDDAAKEEHEAWETVATVLTMLCLFGSLALVIVMVALDVRYEEAVSRAQRQLRSSILRVLDLHKPEDRAHPGDHASSKTQRPALFGSMAKRVRQVIAWRNAVQPSDEGARAAETANGGAAPVVGLTRRRASVSQREEGWSMARKAVEAEPLELHRSLDIGCVRKWLANLQASGTSAHDSVALPAHLPKRSRQDGVMQQVLQFITRSEPSATTRDVMPSTMNASQVKVPAKVQAGLVRFWLTNHWMHAALADTSPVSHYSHRPGSVFFGNFVAGTPFLVDHMLYADEQQLGNMKAVLNHMRAAQPVFGSEGRLAKLISHVHRGPLLSWLMVADSARITTFRRLLQDVYETNHEGWHPLSASAQRMDGNRFSAWVDNAVRQYLPQPERFGIETVSPKDGGVDDEVQSETGSSAEPGILKSQSGTDANPVIALSGKVSPAAVVAAFGPARLKRPVSERIAALSDERTASIEDNALAIPAVTKDDAVDLDPLSAPHHVPGRVGFQAFELESPFEAMAGDRENVAEKNGEAGGTSSVAGIVSKGELARLDDEIRELSGFGSEVESYLCTLERKITQKVELTTANRNFRRQRTTDNGVGAVPRVTQLGVSRPNKKKSSQRQASAPEL